MPAPLHRLYVKKKSHPFYSTNLFLANMDAQLISFAHTPWPHCTVELLSYDDAAPDFPSAHGSGFFVQREHRVFLVTAGHCLVPGAGTRREFLDKAKKVVARLMVPMEWSLGARTLKASDYIQFSSVGYVVIDNNYGEFFGTEKEGHLDIAILEVNTRQTNVAKYILPRSVKLPPTGEWFTTLMKSALEKKINVSLFASGFPKNGTENSIDYEGMHIVTQCVHLLGKYCSSGPYPHTHTMKLEQGSPRYEPDGMSGGPIYMRTRNGDNPPYMLVGMALRGGHGSDLIHFCTVDWLTKALQEMTQT